MVGFKFHALAYLNIDYQLFSQSHTEKQRNCNAVNFFRLFVIQKEIIIHNLGYSQNIQYILHDIRTVENECKKDHFNYVYELSNHFRFEVRKKFRVIVEDGDSVQYSKIEVYLKPPKKSYQHLSFGIRFNVHFWLHLCKVQSQINKLILISLFKRHHLRMWFSVSAVTIVDSNAKYIQPAIHSADNNWFRLI